MVQMIFPAFLSSHVNTASWGRVKFNDIGNFIKPMHDISMGIILLCNNAYHTRDIIEMDYTCVNC